MNDSSWRGGLPIPQLTGELRGSMATVRQLRASDLDATQSVDSDGPVMAEETFRGRMDSLALVHETLRHGERSNSLPLAVLRNDTSRICGVAAVGGDFAPDGVLALHSTRLMTNSWRLGTRLEVKYLVLRHAFELWCVQRVEVTSSLLRGAGSAAGREDVIEEDSVVYLLMEDTGRVDDIRLFQIYRNEWPALRIRLESRIGRMLQSTLFPAGEQVSSFPKRTRPIYP